MEDIDDGRSAPDRTRASARHDGGDLVPPVDLTGIDPVHWADTRERVAILRAWCANGRHPRSEALAAAGRMNVTVSHFYRLVAAWKHHRDARLVSGHQARRGDARGPRSMSADARAAMIRIIARHGPEGRFTDVLEDVREECAAAGVTAPSSGMVHRELMRARQASVPDAGAATDDIAVAVVTCLLPVTAAGTTIDAPDLILAVERPGGMILGHQLVLNGDLITAARDVLAGIPAPARAPILVSSPLADAAPTDDPRVGLLGAEGARITVDGRTTLLSTTLGSYIDSIPIRHRRSNSRSPSPWKPLTSDDAVAAVDLAVAAHNAARRD